MRSVADQIRDVWPPWLARWPSRWRAGAVGLDRRSAGRTQAGVPRRRRCGAQHGTGLEHAQARGFFDPKTPAGTPTPRRSRAGSGRHSAPAAPSTPRQATQPPAPTPRRPQRDAGRHRRRLRRRRWRWWQPPELRQLRSRVLAATTSSSATSTASTSTTSRTRDDRDCWRRSSARAVRATFRCTATCCSCRSSRRAGASTAASQGVPETVSKERFRGVRIFDITDIRKPKQVAAVQTCRGSHTHTLVTDPKDKANIYVYGSGTGAVRSGEELEGCSGGEPEEDPNTALFSIDVIKVPLAAPEKAAIVNRPRIFADPKTGAVAGLWAGGDHGPGTQRTSTTNQCHDITVFPEVGLAAGACSGNGILLDISDPVNPVRLDARQSTRTSPTGTRRRSTTTAPRSSSPTSGAAARARAAAPRDLPTWGADAIFDIVDKKLQFGGYYKMPAAQTEQENCVAHNGSLIPVPGRDIMVQGWYQGGLSVFDFTDSANPVEIAFFDRGPIDAKQLITGGFWSTYWYNGHIYGAEIARGIDIFRLTAERIPVAERDRRGDPGAHAPSSTRSSSRGSPGRRPSSSRARISISSTRSKSAAGRARQRPSRARIDRGDRAVDPARADLDQLDSLAGQLEKDASAATGRDAMRIGAGRDDQGRAAARRRESLTETELDYAAAPCFSEFRMSRDCRGVLCSRGRSRRLGSRTCGARRASVGAQAGRSARRAQGRPCAMRAWRHATWSCWPTCPSPTASSIPRRRLAR